MRQSVPSLKNGLPQINSTLLLHPRMIFCGTLLALPKNLAISIRRTLRTKNYLVVAITLKVP